MSRRDRPAQIRRPRYVAFLVTGMAVGLLATIVLSLSVRDSVDSTARVLVYLGILLGGLGALAGGAVAVWLERDPHDS